MDEITNDPNEIGRIISELEERTSEENAQFGIQQYGGGPDESYIIANKNGLRLFALELLEAANEEDREESSAKSIHYLDVDARWISEKSDTFVYYVERINDDEKISLETYDGESGITKLIGLGCIMIFLAGIALLIIGIITVFRWL